MGSAGISWTHHGTARGSISSHSALTVVRQRLRDLTDAVDEKRHISQWVGGHFLPVEKIDSAIRRLQEQRRIRIGCLIHAPRWPEDTSLRSRRSWPAARRRPTGGAVAITKSTRTKRRPQLNTPVLHHLHRRVALNPGRRRLPSHLWLRSAWLSPPSLKVSVDAPSSHAA
jgi:hypothetical protein